MLAGRTALGDGTFPDSNAATNTRPPQTPFAAVMGLRAQDWAAEFLTGVAGGLGYVKTPPTDSLTPPVAVTGTADAGPLSPSGLAGNPLIALAVLGVLGLVAWKFLD